MKTEIQQHAEQLARAIRAEGHGYLTLTKEGLRQAFDISRLTERQADEITAALHELDFHVDPLPQQAASSVRIYDRAHALGKLAWTILHPEDSTDGPLRQVGAVLKRAEDGKAMRSDDIPWLEAFDLLLQLIHGHEPSAWEDLRDDRHPTMLARELAAALRLPVETFDLPWLPRLAAAVCRLRPLSAPLRPDEFSVAGRWQRAEELVRVLEAGSKRVQTERQNALRAAGALLFGAEPPVEQVELGVLGLRRRSERNP